MCPLLGTCQTSKNSSVLCTEMKTYKIVTKKFKNSNEKLQKSYKIVRKVTKELGKFEKLQSYKKVKMQLTFPK